MTKKFAIRVEIDRYGWVTKKKWFFVFENREWEVTATNSYYIGLQEQNGLKRFVYILSKSGAYAFSKDAEYMQMLSTAQGISRYFKEELN